MKKQYVLTFTYTDDDFAVHVASGMVIAAEDRDAAMKIASRIESKIEIEVIAVLSDKPYFEITCAHNDFMPRVLSYIFFVPEPENPLFSSDREVSESEFWHSYEKYFNRFMDENPGRFKIQRILRIMSFESISYGVEEIEEVNGQWIVHQQPVQPRSLSDIPPEDVEMLTQAGLARIQYEIEHMGRHPSSHPLYGSSNKC